MSEETAMENYEPFNEGPTKVSGILRCNRCSKPGDATLVPVDEVDAHDAWHEQQEG